MIAPLDAGPDRNTVAIAAASLSLGVGNFADVATAYGEWFAEGFLDCLSTRAAIYLGRDEVPVLVRDDRRFLSIGELAQGANAEALLVALGSEPVVINGIPVLPVLTFGDPDALRLDEAPSLQLGNAHYRRLMTEAVAAYKALRDRRLALAFQSIRSADGDGLLYREVLARIVPEDGGSELIGPGAFVPALEQLRLARLFDRAVVMDTLAALRMAPSSRLGCNISAQSAADDEYWTSIFALLAAEPDIAGRLIVEITETAGFPDPDAAQWFVARLKRLGCEVAVDDFGVGCNSISLTAMLRPSIVKIDGSFLRVNAGQIFGGEFVQSLIRLSSCLAAHVVVEGVEDEICLQLAMRAGARWLQGYYIDLPAIGLDRAGGGRLENGEDVEAIARFCKPQSGLNEEAVR
ncbi:EAL domain-containing protein [Shinella sp. NM-101]|uniref:EAL domain-containing protein n=1 Tax=Shinella sp. NM-101 TaxID=2744455 RepID=UPI001F37A8A2|nr:EAL domain-containing protein [Shinella sp. NM-101]